MLRGDQGIHDLLSGLSRPICNSTKGRNTDWDRPARIFIDDVTAHAEALSHLMACLRRRLLRLLAQGSRRRQDRQRE